jgi:hypothetical protein
LILWPTLVSNGIVHMDGYSKCVICAAFLTVFIHLFCCSAYRRAARRVLRKVCGKKATLIQIAATKPTVVISTTQ